MRRIICLLCLPLFLSGLPRGFSQEAAGSPLFAPFVSRLQGEIRNNLIRLQWLDSPTIRGSVYIYRSKIPFDEIPPTSLENAVEVPYGVQSYIDEAEEPGTWHYFIAASAESGERYLIYIPYSNLIAITIPETVRLPLTLGRGESRIYSITAEVRGEGVMISYRTLQAGLAVVLYRSVTPIRTTEDLLRAVILQSSLSSSPYMDYPISGIPYYYALIPENELVFGTVGIFPGFNATINPVEVSVPYMGLDSGPRVRAIPLPLISITALRSESGEGYGSRFYSGETPREIPLNREVEEILRDILPSKAAAPVEKHPRAFNRDLQTPVSLGGEEYTLRSIVQGSFQKRDWPAAQEELLRYLSIPRSTASEARARYYLGQTYYFTGAFREALFEFLFTRSSYPDEANEWIQALLPRLGS